MAQYDFLKKISPKRFIEIMVLLCQTEFPITYINFASLLAFIGKCKKANRYLELVVEISILENDYSPEMIDALKTGKRNKIIDFKSGFIEILEINKEQKRRVIELEIEDLDIMRSFLIEFFNLIEQVDQNQVKASTEYAVNRSRIKEVPK